jgi:hypothetical protein
MASDSAALDPAAGPTDAAEENGGRPSRVGGSDLENGKTVLRINHLISTDCGWHNLTRPCSPFGSPTLIAGSGWAVAACGQEQRDGHP